MKTYLHECRRLFLFVTVFSVFINMLILVAPVYTLQVYDRVLASRSLETLVMLTLMALFALVAFALLDMFRIRLLAAAGTKLEEVMAAAVLCHALDNAADQQALGGNGLRDLKVLRNFVASNAPVVFFDFPWALVFVGLLFVFDTLLGFIALLGFFSLLVLAFVDDRVSRRAIESATTIGRRAVDFSEACVSNAEVVRAIGMFTAVRERWEALITATNDEARLGTRRSTGVLAASRYVRQALQIVMLGAGAFLVVRQNNSPGVMIAATIVFGRAMAPIETAIASWRGLIEARSAYRRLDHMLQGPDREAKALSLPLPRGALSVERLVYAPHRDRVLIRGISFELQAGEFLGLIGPSGSGKSTLARLLLNVLKPSSGTVRIDGADLHQWHPETLGALLGYLPQDVQLFEGTVADNIARMRDPQSSSNEIVAAGELAGAHHMILRLPEGYETRIDRSGLMLSAGQRQHIGLARAVFGAPRLVVLDEPNSNLDSEGETALLLMLTKLKEHGTTIVMITHRPSLLRDADRILVLRGGSIAELAPRESILTRLGTRAEPAPAGAILRSAPPAARR